VELIVNSLAAARSSLGVRRLFAGVMQHLAWDSKVSFSRLPKIAPVARVAELLQLGRRDAIYWSPTHRGPLWAHHHVVSLHDCINVEYTFRDDWRLPAFRRVFNLVLRNAQVVVALSRATKDAALRNYSLIESKIVVIPAGFDLPSETAAVAEQPYAGPPFILMVTNALPHKNALRACRAFVDSVAPHNGYVLRVVGSLPPAALGLCGQDSAKIEVHGHVADAQLRSWYRNAAFLFSPSLAEGYNLPVAEAVASGGNVLCSDIAVHREFFQGRAAFFDPGSEDSMVEALNGAVMKAGTRWYPGASKGRLRSFKDMADDYRAVFRGIEREHADEKIRL
jgi:glycosyltransferase involved in cell wall biosynthesis